LIPLSAFCGAAGAAVGVGVLVDGVVGVDVGVPVGTSGLGFAVAVLSADFTAALSAAVRGASVPADESRVTFAVSVVAGVVAGVGAGAGVVVGVCAPAKAGTARMAAARARDFMLDFLRSIRMRESWRRVHACDGARVHLAPATVRGLGVGRRHVAGGPAGRAAVRAQRAQARMTTILRGWDSPGAMRDACNSTA
jgi:hypothetical protein